LIIVYVFLILIGAGSLADRAKWARLTALQPADPARYDPAIVATLPESAQRFFNFVIKSGTPLFTVAEIDMGGEFRLSSRDKPNPRPMDARQILAAPYSFVWMLRIPGAVSLSGSDTGKRTHFRLFGLVPIALGASLPAITIVAGTFAVGLVGYGISLVLLVLALRELGTARTGAYYSTAPFIGATISLVVLGESTSVMFWFAAFLMGCGVWLHLTEHHEHVYAPMAHSHPHSHD